MARRKEKKENSALKTIVILLAILVIVFPAAAFGYVYFKLSSIHDSSANEVILNENNFQAEKGITKEVLGDRAEALNNIRLCDLNEDNRRIYEEALSEVKE